MTKNPLLLLGMQRSGTNFALEIIRTIGGTKIFNEDDEAAFSGFLLKPSSVIRELVASNHEAVCVFKAITDSLRFRAVKSAFPNAGFIYIFRRPKEVIDSYAQEFGGQLHGLNHILSNDFFNNHLLDITGISYDLPRVDQLLGEYQGRFSASGDYADKIALYWIVFHLFLIDAGALSDKASFTVSYDEVCGDPTAVRRNLCARFGLNPDADKEPPKVQQRESLFTERVSMDLMKKCEDVYAELERVRLSQYEILELENARS